MKYRIEIQTPSGWAPAIQSTPTTPNPERASTYDSAELAFADAKKVQAARPMARIRIVDATSGVMIWGPGKLGQAPENADSIRRGAVYLNGGPVDTVDIHQVQARELFSKSTPIDSPVFRRTRVRRTGGHRLGTVEASYADLAALFGKPNSEPSGDGKVSTSWDVAPLMTAPHGALALTLEIYDYCETALYDDSFPTVEEFRARPSYEWHIGGTSKESADRLVQYIESEVAKQKAAVSVVATLHDSGIVLAVEPNDLPPGNYIAQLHMAERLDAQSEPARKAMAEALGATVIQDSMIVEAPASVGRKLAGGMPSFELEVPLGGNPEEAGERFVRGATLRFLKVLAPEVLELAKNLVEAQEEFCNGAHLLKNRGKGMGDGNPATAHERTALEGETAAAYNAAHEILINLRELAKRLGAVDG